MYLEIVRLDILNTILREVFINIITPFDAKKSHNSAQSRHTKGHQLGPCTAGTKSGAVYFEAKFEQPNELQIT